MIAMKKKTAVAAACVAAFAVGAIALTAPRKAFAQELATIGPETYDLEMTVGAGQAFTAELSLDGCYLVTLSGDIGDENTVVTAAYGKNYVTQFTWSNLYTSAVVAGAEDKTITFAANSSTALTLYLSVMYLDTENCEVWEKELVAKPIIIEGLSFVPYIIADAGEYKLTVTNDVEDYLMVIGPTYTIEKTEGTDEAGNVIFTYTFTTPANNSYLLLGNKDFGEDTFDITFQPVV